MSRKSPRVNGSRLAPSIEAQIDSNLRRVFEEDASQELPERLRALIDRLGNPDPGKPAETADTPESEQEDARAPHHPKAIAASGREPWVRR